MTDPITEVTVTVTVAGNSKTFAARGETTGQPAKAARGLLNAISDDAREWLHDIENPTLARAAGRR